MADKMTPEQRHRCMASIKSKNTKPEVIVRKFLFAHGFRFRINVKRLPGTPDIVLKKYRTCIFVNGCFWHGHEGCRHYVLPKINTDFWKAKIERNKERDLDRRIKLRDMGWHVIQFWECQLKPNVREATLEEVVRLLQRSFVETHYQAHFSPYTLPDTDDLPLAAEDRTIYNRKGQTD